MGFRQTYDRRESPRLEIMEDCSYLLQVVPGNECLCECLKILETNEFVGILHGEVCHNVQAGNGMGRMCGFNFLERSNRTERVFQVVFFRVY